MLSSEIKKEFVRSLPKCMDAPTLASAGLVPEGQMRNFIVFKKVAELSPNYGFTKAVEIVSKEIKMSERHVRRICQDSRSFVKLIQK